MGCSYKFAPVFRELFSEKWLALAILRVNGQHPVGQNWAQSEKKLSELSVLQQFLLFTFFGSLYTLLFSLSKGKGNLFDEEISIPNWGGHWS